MVVTVSLRCRPIRGSTRLKPSHPSGSRRSTPLRLQGGLSCFRAYGARNSQLKRPCRLRLFGSAPIISVERRGIAALHFKMTALEGLEKSHTAQKNLKTAIGAQDQNSSVDVPGHTTQIFFV